MNDYKADFEAAADLWKLMPVIESRLREGWKLANVVMLGEQHDKCYAFFTKELATRRPTRPAKKG